MEVERRIESASRDAVRQRNYRRVRDRALTRLGALHKEEYLTLLEEEKAKDEVEGKAWLDISGRTRLGMGRPTVDTNSQDTEATEGRGNRAKARNLG